MPQTALENETVEEVVETPEAVEEEFEVVVEDDTPKKTVIENLCQKKLWIISKKTSLKNIL